MVKYKHYNPEEVLTQLSKHLRHRQTKFRFLLSLEANTAGPNMTRLFYYKYGKEGSYVMSTVTLDGFLVAASDKKEIGLLNSILQSKYKTKRLGFPTTYLNWSITRDD